MDIFIMFITAELMFIKRIMKHRWQVLTAKVQKLPFIKTNLVTLTAQKLFIFSSASVIERVDVRMNVYLVIFDFHGFLVFLFSLFHMRKIVFLQIWNAVFLCLGAGRMHISQKKKKKKIVVDVFPQALSLNFLGSVPDPKKADLWELKVDTLELNPYKNSIFDPFCAKKWTSHTPWLWAWFFLFSIHCVKCLNITVHYSSDLC